MLNLSLKGKLKSVIAELQVLLKRACPTIRYYYCHWVYESMNSTLTEGSVVNGLLSFEYGGGTFFKQTPFWIYRARWGTQIVLYPHLLTNVIESEQIRCMKHSNVGFIFSVYTFNLHWVKKKTFSFWKGNHKSSLLMNNFAFQFCDSSFWYDDKKKLLLRSAKLTKQTKKTRGHKKMRKMKTTYALLSGSAAAVFQSRRFAYCRFLQGSATWAQRLGLPLRHAQNGHLSTPWGRFLFHGPHVDRCVHEAEQKFNIITWHTF